MTQESNNTFTARSDDTAMALLALGLSKVTGGIRGRGLIYMARKSFGYREVVGRTSIRLQPVHLIPDRSFPGNVWDGYAPEDLATLVWASAKQNMRIVAQRDTDGSWKLEYTSTRPGMTAYLSKFLTASLWGSIKITALIEPDRLRQSLKDILRVFTGSVSERLLLEDLAQMIPPNEIPVASSEDLRASA